MSSEFVHDGLFWAGVVNLFDFVFVEEVGSDVGLELVGEVLFEEVSVEFAHLFFVDFFGLADHVNEGADVINKKAEYHAAHNFNKRKEETLDGV